mgnify:CR=1 FL=1
MVAMRPVKMPLSHDASTDHAQVRKPFSRRIACHEDGRALLDGFGCVAAWDLDGVEAYADSLLEAALSHS